MLGKKVLPLGTLFLVLVMALAMLGIGYALWSTTLTDEGVVNTGSFSADWFDVFTDDDGDAYKPGYDDGDTGDCGTGAGSCDPKEPGPNPARYTKGVGACAAWIVDTEDHQILHWQLDTTYPSYYCTVWGHIRNTGSIPMKLQSRSLERSHPAKFTTGFVSGVACGTQIDPGDLLPIGMWVHVEQEAEPESTYTGNSSYELVQWNEYDPGLCTGW
jgi:hypothetical protein